MKILTSLIITLLIVHSVTSLPWHHHCCDEWHQVSEISAGIEDITSITKRDHYLAIGSELGQVGVWKFKRNPFNTYENLRFYAFSQSQISHIAIFNVSSSNHMALIVALNVGTVHIYCIDQMLEAQCNIKENVISSKHVDTEFHEKPIHFASVGGNTDGKFYVAAHDEVFVLETFWAASALRTTLKSILFNFTDLGKPATKVVADAITGIYVHQDATHGDVLIIALRRGDIVMHVMNANATYELFKPNADSNEVMEHEHFMSFACYLNMCASLNESSIVLYGGTNHGYVVKLIININEKRVQRVLIGDAHTNAIISMQFINSTMFVYNKENTTGFVSVAAGEEEVLENITIGSHADFVTHVYFDQSSGRLVTSGLDQMVRVWAPPSPDLLATHRTTQQIPDLVGLTSQKTVKAQHKEDNRRLSPWELFQIDVKQIMRVTMREFLTVFEASVEKQGSEAHQRVEKWLRDLRYTREEVDEILEKIEEALSDQFLEL